MAFRFRLQSVLDHRQHLEDEAMQGFAQKLQVQQECERHIDWLEQEHRRSRVSLQPKEVSGMPAPEFQMVNEYSTVLRLQVLREQSRLPMLQAETEVFRLKFIEARRERKVLDILKEKHHQRYQKKELLAEQKIIDEAAVSAYRRRKAS